MKHILVGYTSMAGSTREVAQTIADELSHSGLEAEIRPLAEVHDLQGYDGLVVGGPMIMGWHRSALSFLRKHHHALQNLPVAIFVLAMSLTHTAESGPEDIRVLIDSKLPKSPAQPGHLTFRERYATVRNYLTPIVNVLRPAKPVSIGLFGGRLEYGRLPWWAVLFAMLVIQAPAGDRRNWPVIRAWAADLGPAFGAGKPTEAQRFAAPEPAIEALPQ